MPGQVALDPTQWGAAPADPTTWGAQPVDPTAWGAIPEVGKTEDIAKSAASGAAKGAIGTVMSPIDLPALAAQGLGWLAPKILGIKPGQEQAVQEAQSKLGTTMVDPDTGQEMPAITSRNVVGAISPYLHEPQTEAGKTAERLGEKTVTYGSSAALGPSGMMLKALTGGGALAGSEAGRYAAQQLSASPGWEQAADILGGVAGGGIPGVWAAKRLPPVTATAQSDAQTLGEIGVKMHPAIEANRPYGRQLTANVGPVNAIGNLREDFSTGIAKKLGITPGPDNRISPEALNTAYADVTNKWPKVRDAAEITGPQFENYVGNLPNVLKGARRGLEADSPEFQGLQDVANRISTGAANTEALGSIPGQRYEVLHDILRDRMKNAGPGTKNTYYQMLTGLEDAMANSKGGPELQRMHQDYRDLSGIARMGLGPDQKITPELIQQVTDNTDYNRGRGLSKYAQAGQRMLAKLPEPTDPVHRYGIPIVAGLAAKYGSNDPEAWTRAIWYSGYAAPFMNQAVYRGLGQAAYNTPMMRALLGPQSSATPAQASALAAALAGTRAGQLPAPNQP